MEEVDGIIAHTLRSIGCNIDENVESISQFTTEHIFEATARCIKCINDVELSYKLPPSMSAKFRIGAALASAVQELGYRGEVGYQTFLYSNEAEIRRVLMFLIEKLPKESAQVTEDAMSSSALLRRSIAESISARLSMPWTPAHFKRDGICWRGTPSRWYREGCKTVRRFNSVNLSSPEEQNNPWTKLSPDVRAYYNSANLSFIDRQPRHRSDLVPSVLSRHSLQLTEQQEWSTEWNQLGLKSRLTPQEYKARKKERIMAKIGESLSRGMAEAESTSGSTNQDLSQLISEMSDRSSMGGARTKGSRFTHVEKLQFTKDEVKDVAPSDTAVTKADTEEERQRKRESEVEELQSSLGNLNAKLEEAENEYKTLTARKTQMEEKLADGDKVRAEKAEAYKMKKNIMDLLPNAEDNIAKLQELVDNSAQRLVNLANQWEKHRAPLVEQYRKLREAASSRQGETEKKLMELQLMREQMGQLANEARTKDSFYKQLVSEYQRMTKDVNRSAYTRRIMEIVANIKKQKEAIDQVLIDTRGVQKDINRLTGKLERTFTVTDELIFKDAKKDESVRKAYKHLAALHENCGALVQTVEETGVILREIRELEDQIDLEMKKSSAANLEKIMADFTAMKKENAQLMAKYKQSF